MAWTAWADRKIRYARADSTRRPLVSDDARQSLIIVGRMLDALARLLPAMLAARGIDLPRALLRGRNMAAVPAMEHNGIPLDRPMLRTPSTALVWYSRPVDRPR